MSGKRGWQIIVGTLLTGAGLAGLTALVMAGWLQGPKISNAPQKLPDGTVLKLVQIDYGKTNIALDDGLFERMRRRFVLSAGLALMGWQVIPPLPKGTNYNLALNAEGELVFALQHLGLTYGPGPGFVQMQGDWRLNTLAVAFDELGHEYAGGAGRFDARSIMSGGTNPITTWHLGAFPREGKLVGLRIYRQGSGGVEWKPVAEFVTHNPSRGPHPEWEPEPQPATHHVGKLGVTVRDFVVRKSPGGVASQGSGYNSEFTLSISEAGVRTNTWCPRSVTLTDANGNRAYSGVTTGSTSEHGTVCRFVGNLDPEQPWKLRLELNRDMGTAWPELWQLRDVPIPAGGAPKAIYTTNLNGALMTLEFLSAQTLIGQISPPNAGWQMEILGVVDDQGRKVSSGASPSSGPRIVRLNPPADAKSLTVTMAYQKSVFAEFIVKPRVETQTAAGRIPSMTNSGAMRPERYWTSGIPPLPNIVRPPTGSP